MTARSLLLKLHLWSGLAAALPLIVVAVTGALLVYGEEIDQAVDPQLFYVSPGATRLPAQELLDRIRAAYPAERLLGFTPGARPELSSSSYSASRLYIYIDPYTGRILGAKHLETGVRRKLFLIHAQLMAGSVGHIIVVASTSVAIFLILTGLVLWWKYKILGVKWRSGFWRFNFDVHSVLGLYSAVVFLVLCVTGIMIAYDGAVYPAILRWSGAPTAQSNPQSRVRGGPGPSLDEVIAIAERTLPGARVTTIGLPSKPTDLFTVYSRFPDDPSAFGRSRVRVDRYSGEVLFVKDTRAANWGQYVVDFTEATHFGDIFGNPTRVIAFAVSLLVAGQVVSGALIWWKKP
jgi:uncharacterized iron-regulated membrane protein